MLCQWWLLGVRNEAHDNVPGWVPLCVSHCYGNGTGFPLTEGGCCLFSICYSCHRHSFHVCIELSAKYIMLCNTAPLCISCIYGSVWKNNKRTTEQLLSFSCVFFPLLSPPPTAAATVQPVSRRGCLEKQKRKIHWHKRSFGCLIFRPLAFKVKWHERR